MSWTEPFETGVYEFRCTHLNEWQFAGSLTYWGGDPSEEGDAEQALHDMIVALQASGNFTLAAGSKRLIVGYVVDDESE